MAPPAASRHLADQPGLPAGSRSGDSESTFSPPGVGSSQLRVQLLSRAFSNRSAISLRASSRHINLKTQANSAEKEGVAHSMAHASHRLAQSAANFDRLPLATILAASRVAAVTGRPNHRTGPKRPLTALTQPVGPSSQSAGCLCWGSCLSFPDIGRHGPWRGRGRMCRTPSARPHPGPPFSSSRSAC